jgi:YceI-like domain
MKKSALLLLTLFIFFSASAQKYMTKTGSIGFFSHTPVEDIKADNNQVASVLDLATGEIVFQVLIKSFHFEKALMEEHFNENYMDSEKFPRSAFRGKITGYTPATLSKPGKYELGVEGDLTIRDVTKKVSAKGTFVVAAGEITAESKFDIAPEDYKIEIPGVVREKIAKSLAITVSIKYTPLETK